MTNIERYAIEITKEIVVSKMSSSDVSPSEAGGENVADFFEAIYNKVLSIASGSDAD